MTLFISGKTFAASALLLDCVFESNFYANKVKF